MSEEATEVRFPPDAPLPPSARPVSPLHTEAQSLLQDVRSALADRANKDVFAIGGSIADRPVTIRWNTGGEWNQGRMVSLPVDQDQETSTRAFNQLLEDCQPATFGRGNEDVLDEEYRKAGKLDASHFSTNFNPYEHGVIDTITQALIQASHAKDNIWGVRAELYKLNVYSAPSGKFKSHVDTPRSERQMGSLVVCFPHPHEGGRLSVRHAGQEVAFDWSSDNSSTVHWAAFFSDCEHEVFEVTKGHRITLAYNLFWTPYGPTSMADRLDLLEQDSLPFFKTLRRLLNDPTFLNKSRKVGFTCTHAYPHTSQSAVESLHLTLKGLDMVIFQALKRLVGDARVTAVIDMKDYEECMYGWYKKRPAKDPEAHTTSAVFAKALTTPMFEDGYYDDRITHPEEVLRSWSYQDERNRRMWHEEQVYFSENVTWLNHAPDENTAKEFSIGYITYGNEASHGSYYSSAVIIADLEPPKKPPSAETGNVE